MLIIEIEDIKSGNILIRDGDTPLSGITHLKLEVDSVEIPPVLRVQFPEEGNVPEEMRPGIAEAIKAIQRHGGQVSFAPLPKIESFPDEQKLAEEKLKSIIE